MSGFQTAERPRPVLGNGPPSTVPYERVGRKPTPKFSIDHIPASFRPHAIATRIVFDIAKANDILPEDIKGPSRKAKFVKPRMEAIAAVAVALPNWSLPKLGQFFGNRDHTTVMHSIRKMGVVR